MPFKYSLEKLGSEYHGDVSKANQFIKDLSKFKTGNNCQKFAAALELKFRGKDVDVSVTPSPVSRVFDVPKGREYPYSNWCLTRTGQFVKFSGNDPSHFVSKLMTGFGKNSRAFVSITFKNSQAGHVFNAMCLDNDVWILDATARKMWTVDKCPYMSQLDPDRSNGILRVDNASIDQSMINDTFQPDVKEFFFDNDPSKQFISVVEGLSLVGVKGNKFQVFRKNKSIGWVVCNDVTEKYDDWYGKGKPLLVWSYSWS